mmetsp:Transcript_18848/g.13672  ORF Transcript_18848/g.13672 Transcript_18848/m.13672 type:complete len:139 (+) Transcript_18848:566-982(+)
MEIISLLSNAAGTKEKEFKELLREKKNVEHRLEITEKEKNLCKRQLDLLHSSSPTSSQPLQKSPVPPGNRLADEVERILEGGGQWTSGEKCVSPFLQKYYQEKENQQNAKRGQGVATAQQRSGSGRRAYLTQAANQKQ